MREAVEWGKKAGLVRKLTPGEEAAIANRLARPAPPRKPVTLNDYTPSSSFNGH